MQTFLFYGSLVFFWLISAIAVGAVEDLRDAYAFDTLGSALVLGSLPNFIAAFLVPMPFAFSQYKFGKFLGYYTLGLIGYELVQRWISYATCDPVDVAFSILGAGCCLLVINSLRGIEVLLVQQFRREMKRKPISQERQKIAIFSSSDKTLTA